MTEDKIRAEIEKYERLKNHLDEICKIRMSSITDLFDQNAERVKNDKTQYGYFSNQFLKNLKGKNVLSEVIDQPLFEINADNGKTISKYERTERTALKLVEEKGIFLHDDFDQLLKQIRVRMEK